ncbi:hypothetical protein [Thalassotalea litorea]|uniref:hypothetical protein n=1 Tax=Thalassotalea litorea TaxID=2020715 RepID=UPI003736C70C
MKTLTVMTLSILILLSQPTFAEERAKANNTIPDAPSSTARTTVSAYTVNYVQEVDIIAQKTQHSLQYLEYTGQTQIYQQARQTVLEIGKQTQQLQNRVALTGTGEHWSDSDNAAR